MTHACGHSVARLQTGWVDYGWGKTEEATCYRAHCSACGKSTEPVDTANRAILDWFDEHFIEEAMVLFANEFHVTSDTPMFNSYLSGRP